MDRRPRWKTRGRRGDIDPTRPARIASSRQRRIRTSGTVPLRAPRRRARLIPRRTRGSYPSPQSALAGATAHGAHGDRRPTNAMRRYAAPWATPSKRPLGTNSDSADVPTAGSWIQGERESPDDDLTLTWLLLGNGGQQRGPTLAVLPLRPRRSGSVGRRRRRDRLGLTSSSSSRSAGCHLRMAQPKSSLKRFLSASRSTIRQASAPSTVIRLSFYTHSDVSGIPG